MAKETTTKTAPGRAGAAARPAAGTTAKTGTEKAAVPVARRIGAPPVADEAPAKERPAGAILRKKDLLDQVQRETGAAKKAVREIVEATLAALGTALSAGQGLNLPPLGKAKVARPEDAGAGKAMTVKLRRDAASGAGKTPLADDGEDG